MNDFEIVPDSERTEHALHGARAQIHAALLDGKTLFIPFDGQVPVNLQNAIRNFLRTRQYLLRIRKQERNGVAGFLAWAEPKADR